ncbi:MAG: hypothetical protein WCB68_17865, partial [Pyrinomonadaceae bacterium]
VFNQYGSTFPVEKGKVEDLDFSSHLFGKPAPLPFTPSAVLDEMAAPKAQETQQDLASEPLADLFDEKKPVVASKVVEEITPDDEIKAAPVEGSAFASSVPTYDVDKGAQLAPGRQYRVKIPIDKTDTPETVLRKGLIASAQAVGLRETAESAADEMYADLVDRGVTGARHAGTDTPITSKDVEDLQRDGETTFDLSDDPRLVEILNRYITSGQSGESQGLNPNETVNARNLRREVERMPPMAQGFVKGMGSVDRTIGGALSTIGMDKADEFTKSAKTGERVADDVMRRSPDQSFSANLQRGVGEAVPNTAELMSLQQTRVPLVISGALKHADEGAGGELRGAAEGALMQGGMKIAPALGIGRVGNAALWTLVPATMAINQGESPSKAFASALPYGAMALIEGGRERERTPTLADFINASSHATVERANPNAPLGSEPNEDGTISFTVPAKDGSGPLRVSVKVDARAKQAALAEAKQAFDANDADATDAAYVRALSAGASDAEIRAAMSGDPSPVPSKAMRAGKTALDLWDATRAVKTSFDFSAPRNSLILTLTHPVKAARAFGQSVNAFRSEAAARSYTDAINNDSLKNVADLAGLDITDSSGPLSKREEMFHSSLAEKIPGVRSSERAFHQYLNSIRFSTFKDYALSHPGATVEDLAGVARAINFFSGRGSFGPLEGTKVVQGLSRAFYAPRLSLSYVQSFASPFMG